MALSSLGQAFFDACEACKTRNFEGTPEKPKGLRSMLHDKATAFYIDNPLWQPIYGKEGFLAYLKDKVQRHPLTSLEISEDTIVADMQTGIVTGPGVWHDNNEKGGPDDRPVNYRFHFTPDPAFPPYKPVPGPVNNWLLLYMYAEIV